MIVPSVELFTFWTSHHLVRVCSSLPPIEVASRFNGPGERHWRISSDDGQCPDGTSIGGKHRHYSMRWFA